MLKALANSLEFQTIGFAKPQTVVILTSHMKLQRSNFRKSIHYYRQCMISIGNLELKIRQTFGRNPEGFNKRTKVGSQRSN